MRVITYPSKILHPVLGAENKRDNRFKIIQNRALGAENKRNDRSKTFQNPAACCFLHHNDVQKYMYGFLPAAVGNFLAICSPEMHFLKGFEEYLTSKSQKFSPAAQGFGPN